MPIHNPYEKYNKKKKPPNSLSQPTSGSSLENNVLARRDLAEKLAATTPEKLAAMKPPAMKPPTPKKLAATTPEKLAAMKPPAKKPTVAAARHRKQTKPGRPGGKKGIEYSPVRIYMEKWLNLPEFVSWRCKPFLGNHGNKCSALMKKYIWDRLSDADKIDQCGLKGITNTPPDEWNERFSVRVRVILLAARNHIIVVPRKTGGEAHRQKGDKIRHHPDTVMALQRDMNEEELAARKKGERKRRDKYMRTGGTGEASSKAYHQKSAAMVAESRATQVYPQIGS